MNTTKPAPKCGYCGKLLIVQQENGEGADGNIVVIEVDGSQRKACKSCAERLSHMPS